MTVLVLFLRRASKCLIGSDRTRSGTPPVRLMPSQGPTRHGRESLAYGRAADAEAPSTYLEQTT